MRVKVRGFVEESIWVDKFALLSQEKMVAVADRLVVKRHLAFCRVLCFAKIRPENTKKKVDM